MKKSRGVFIKNEREIALLRQANQYVARILNELGSQVRPGLSTMHFEDIVQKMCTQFKVRPAFQGYHGFPFALCCSVNEEVVHGFPSKNRILQEGDIVSFDVGVVYEGFYGDSARTFGVGAISEAASRLLRTTEESLALAIAEARVGNDLNNVGTAVQKHAEKAGFGVVRRFVGHGIGVNLHEKPEIPNFNLGRNVLPLEAGMVLAIEPMITEGSYEVDILEDEWTAVTRDRKLSAHFEHSIVVLSHGPEILSLSSVQA